MPLTRRTVLASAALAAPLASHVAHSSPRLHPSLTVKTAPDAISRHILGEYLATVDRGAAGIEERPAAFSRNFPQLIEQNFAERDAASTAALIDGMSEADLWDLAQLYVNATTAQGRPEKLMFVLAHRLDGRRLGRVARHFGFERTYHAVHAVAPNKAQGPRGFLTFADTREYGPLPGDDRFGINGRYAPANQGDGQLKMSFRPRIGVWRMRKAAKFYQFLDKTIPEIYHAVRTAKYGSLDVEGALLETLEVASGSLGFAAGIGYGFGTYVVLPVIQAYYPNLYTGIGDWIGPTADLMIYAFTFPNNTEAKKTADETGAANFAVGGGMLDIFRETGGDWGCVSGLVRGGSGCFVRCYPFDPL